MKTLHSSILILLASLVLAMPTLAAEIRLRILETTDFRSVANLYIYPNTIKAVRITGAQVREWLEMSAQQFNRIDPNGPPEQNHVNDGFPTFNFDTIGGVRYEIDVTQPPRYNHDGKVINENARRITNLSFNGKPIDEQARFIVVTNNYRAGGGGNFPAMDGTNIVMDAPDENREALIDYFQAVKTFDRAADGNWRIRPVPGIKLRFSSGAGGIKHLSRYPAVKLVKDNGDGSALYELVP